VQLVAESDDAIAWWDYKTKNGEPLLRHNLVRKLKGNYYEGVNYHSIIFDGMVNRPQGGGSTDSPNSVSHGVAKALSLTSIF